MKKKFRSSDSFLQLILILFLTLFSSNAFADINGRTGRTLKSSTSGCSGCHGSKSTGTSVTITGPATVTTGSTNTFTLTIFRAGQSGAGCDISARNGVLNVVSTTIHKSGSELTHNDNIPMVSGSVNILFNYTAPASAVIDTIFATGNATNISGDESGDFWNFAPGFRVVVIPPAKILHLTVLIEGFFNPGSGTLVQDTARVYLRNLSFPYAIVDSAKAFLAAVGTADFSFSNTLNSTPYYIVVNHRNSIETWSAGGNSFNSNSLTYNFTTSASQAYSSNQQLVGSKWTIFSGDVNQDDITDAGDLSHVENEAVNSASGYVQADVNGDEFVDAGDVSIVENNVGLGVQVLTP